VSIVLDQIEAERRERDAAESLLRQLFAGAVHGDLNAPALFASRPCGRVRPVWEVMLDAIEREKLQARVLTVFVKCAAGRGSQREAQELLAQIGAAFADGEVDLVL
jgi:hypothetical protein